MRFDYHFYGVHMRSDWPLPYPQEQAPHTGFPITFELCRGKARSFSRVPRELLHSQEWFCYAGLDRGAYYLRWKGWWEFLISAEGNRIIGRPIGKGSLESFYNYLLTQVLSFALLRQGIESLHCTAMLVGGRAVGFLGDSGYGKSSLAAAFVRSGYPLITDDVLVLQKHGNGFLAYPGLPRVKLFPERAEKLLGRPVKGTRMNPSTAKMVIPLLPEETCRTAVPLRSLYVLNSPATARQSKKVTIKRLSRREAFVALIQNNFNSRMNVPDRLRGHFFFSSAVAAKTPVSIMSYPRTWTSLAKVCEAVQRDLAR